MPALSVIIGSENGVAARIAWQFDVKAAPSHRHARAAEGPDLGGYGG
jgi:hypothetical protein